MVQCKQAKLFPCPVPGAVIFLNQSLLPRCRLGQLQKSELFSGCSCLKVLTSKPIMASEEELDENPRSRSAKLRIAERI